MQSDQRTSFAIKIASYHLAVNFVVAGLVAVLVFAVWYPQPYRQMLGGLALFSLVAAIDLVCGPVLTAVLANPKKSKREMLIDIVLVTIIQLSALAYGLHMVAIARPVAVVFEVDRFTVVSAVDVLQDSLAKAAKPFGRLPWFGPERISIRPAQSTMEKDLDLNLSLQGIEPSMRADRWMPDSAESRVPIQQKMKPVSLLQKRYPHDKELAATIQKSGLPENLLYYLPFTSYNNREWTVLLDKQAEFKGFVPLDSFF